jgi:hypothetical protein
MEATLANLLADIRNLSWVFIVLGVLFTGLIGYLFTLSRESQKLGSEIEELKHAAEESVR